MTGVDINRTYVSWYILNNQPPLGELQPAAKTLPYFVLENLPTPPPFVKATRTIQDHGQNLKEQL